MCEQALVKVVDPARPVLRTNIFMLASDYASGDESMHPSGLLLPTGGAKRTRLWFILLVEDRPGGRIMCTDTGDFAMGKQDGHAGF
jgi:hypothetical protein